MTLTEAARRFNYLNTKTFASGRQTVLPQLECDEGNEYGMGYLD